MDTTGIRLTASAVLAVLALSSCDTVRFREEGGPPRELVGLGAAAPRLPPEPSAPPAAAAPAGRDVYAATRPGMLSGAVRSLPERLYLPHGASVTVLDPRTLVQVARVSAPSAVRQVVPSWDLKTLWLLGPRLLLPLDPATLRTGRPVRVGSARALLFTQDGRNALLLTGGELQFRDPGTMAPRAVLRLPCVPTARPDFTADGSRLLTACGRTLLDIDWAAGRFGTRWLPAAPSRFLLAPDGRDFLAATATGVRVLDAERLTQRRSIPLPYPVTSLLPGRTGRTVYVSGPGRLSVLDASSGRVLRTVRTARAAELGALSADGRTLWLRSPHAVTAATVQAVAGRSASLPASGLTVHPQPGRFNLGGASLR